LVNKISPEIAISLPFSINARGGITYASDPAKIWADRVRSAIGTVRGERLFRAGYGSLFPLDVLNTEDAVKDSIVQDISETFSSALPALSLEEVIVQPGAGSETVYIEVIYSLPNQDKIRTEIGTITVSGTTTQETL
jgi:hypothetical protein